MNISKAVESIDRRYAWSFLGFALAALFGGISIYAEFFRDTRPNLRYEIVTDASVIDVREQLGKLEIYYDGIDIKKSRQSLRVIVLRVINVGGEDILKGHYDEHAPLGIRVESGNLLRAELLGASSTYLRDTLRITVLSPATAVFAPVILESGESFTVKCLILHPEAARPEVRPIGKVAGVKSVVIVDSSVEEAQMSFVEQVFSGGVWVQILRLVAYFFGLIITIVICVVPVVFISTSLSKRARRKRVREFKESTKLDLSEQDEYIFGRYVEKDIRYLRMLSHFVADPQKLHERVVAHEERAETGVQDVVSLDSEVVVVEGELHRLSYRGPVQDMKRSGFIIKRDDKWEAQAHMKNTLQEFLRFLEVKRDV